ncbi:MAG TPA: heme-copper oxidase subunit III [Bacteroidia bacterium]|nr:heme-copper oxidase subunit III [Bacteroidia bacterium]
MDATITTSKPNVSKVIPDGVLAIIFVLFTESMLFAGLISAYIVNRAGAMVWPPADQPRLPVEVTGVNTLILLSSAVVLYLFTKRVNKVASIDSRSTNLLLVVIMLGATFLAVQGTEWARLIGYGLTTHSSIYGAFFYTLIGAHGLHVLVGLGILLYLYFAIRKASSFEMAKNKISACILYWYFVVAIWPILYRLVYFN